MEVELGQLELRYERLRLVRAGRERQLLSSLAGTGQQTPIVVVAGAEVGRFVVIDGYKRVRCLRRLVQDTVRATPLALEEAEALVMSRQMASGESDTALEQGWLLDEMERRFGLSQEELARRFDRSVSWVSRRLALVRDLPDSVQERVRSGEVVAHAAVKYLVPLARAKRSDCEGLVAAVASARLSTREMGLLYGAWRDGTAKTRERLVASPLVMLKVIKETRARTEEEPGPGQKLLNDFEIIGSVARRAHKHMREGAARRLLPGEREEIARCFEQSQTETSRLAERVREELGDAGRGSTQCHLAAPAEGSWGASDRTHDGPVAQGGQECNPVGVGEGAGAGASGERGAVP